MQYSTNYNLNLVEGTDIVNPLVIDKPNYQIIDGAMKDNADAGISTATEIKTGTVHALTRSNGDANAFRFVATSVFNSGDTFTVDGVTVTALLPSGEALGDNAYVIGCNVFAILTSTELTIFTGGGTAADSMLLDGEPKSFYTDAANIDYDNALSGLTATDVKGAVDEVQTEVTTINNNLIPAPGTYNLSFVWSTSTSFKYVMIPFFNADKVNIGITGCEADVNGTVVTINTSLVSRTREGIIIQGTGTGYDGAFSTLHITVS